MVLQIIGLVISMVSAPDQMIADFEGINYGKWTVTGTAFGNQPAQGSLPGQMSVTGYKGKGLANSFYGNDSSVGTLTSPPFKIDRRYISFLIGGGGWKGKTCLNLLVKGKPVRTATGRNVVAGGNESLDLSMWDVQNLKGQSVQIQIVDNATEGWGHINVDHIIQTDTRPRGLVLNPSRIMKIEKPYLNFPVSNAAPVRKLTVTSPGIPDREFEIKLADGKPDFWVFMDAETYKGKSINIKCDSLPNDGDALKAIEQANGIQGAKDLYSEALRPQFHFSSRRGWLNDPNGMVFHDGEYHLYYQHNPYGWDWGNMHWGHAVSPDMVHWKELPVALYQNGIADMAFSGSAVVDAKNSAGFKTANEDVIIAAYTSTGRGECIVYSTDNGRTFKEFEGNPVIKHVGRDPRLLWHEPSHQWVMTVYNELPEDPDPAMHQNISFYTSPNLKDWTYQSRIGNFFECPDFFELPVDGNPNNKKWVLTAASSEYMIGTFDGKTFAPETPKIPGHKGNQFYAAQTFSDIPAQDGRRIQIGWAQNATTPGMPFNQSMAFPCELTLRTTSEGVRLCWQPIHEISRLYGKAISQTNLSLSSQLYTPEVSGDLFDINLNSKDSFTLQIKGMPVTYDAGTQQISAGGITQKAPLKDGKLNLRILVDRTSLELFVNEGELYMPLQTKYHAGANPIEISGANASLDNLTIHELRSVWK